MVYFLGPYTWESLRKPRLALQPKAGRECVSKRGGRVHINNQSISPGITLGRHTCKKGSQICRTSNRC